MNDPSINWVPDSGRDMEVRPYPWEWLVPQVLFVLLAWLSTIPVIVIGWFVVYPAVGHLMQWGQWPWWAKPFVDYDDPDPEAWWWDKGAGSNESGGHWSTRSLKLGYYWWHAVRNPASWWKRNFVKDTYTKDIVQTKGSHIGAMNPAYSWHKQRKAWPYRVRWDKSRPWLLWFECNHAYGTNRYAELKFGCKLAAAYQGMGITIRFHPARKYNEA